MRCVALCRTQPTRNACSVLPLSRRPPAPLYPTGFSEGTRVDVDPQFPSLHPLFTFLKQKAFLQLTHTCRRFHVGLTSKISPLGSMLNFDADVKNTTARPQCENCFFKPPPHALTFHAEKLYLWTYCCEINGNAACIAGNHV